MWHIPVVGRDCGLAASGCSLDDIRSLPVYYMGDWSEIGILVPKLSEAVDLLRTSGYAISTKGAECSVDVALPDLKGVRELVEMLCGNGIACEMGDVIDSIYRG